MKKNLFQLLFALALLAVARPGAATTFKVTASASPPADGTISGSGSYTSGQSVTLVATPTNDCYEFVEWTVGSTESTNNPYTFTITKNESAVATFKQVEYTISTASFPANGGTTSGGGKKGCGTSTTLTAHANAGFAFVDWVETAEPEFAIPSNNLKITVTGDESFVANFKDIKPPTLKITSPTAAEKIGAAGFPIEGTASDNVAVAQVFYSLNGGPWTNASSTDHFTNWYAWVTLKPDSANTVSAYAEDTSGNTNAAVSTKFNCTAAGLAPLSIAGLLADDTEGTNAATALLVSFDSAGYVSVSPGTNDGGGVGAYTYTPTGPNTAELVLHRVFPSQDTNADGKVVELNYVDAFTASYTNNSGGSGTLAFEQAADIVPETLDGSSIVATSSVNANSFSTNSFGSSTYENEESSGTYTFTKFTPMAALVVETPASPASAVGTTNYILLSLTDGGSAISGNYEYESVSATGNEAPDTGTFVVNPGTDDTKFVGPVTLSGLQATITPEGEPSYTRSFGNGTFASLSLKTTNEPTDVGIILANTRVTATTGTGAYLALGPPYAVGLDDETIDVTWKSSASATFTVPSLDETGAAELSKLPDNAPAALTGHTITATPTIKGGEKSTVTFTYNKFTSTGGVNATGTYTYAPYTSTMALVQGGDPTTGETTYFFLEFVSTTSGNYVYAVPDKDEPGGWLYIPGTFTFATTPQ